MMRSSNVAITRDLEDTEMNRTDKCAIWRQCVKLYHVHDDPVRILSP